jgi:hypothetical protein
VVLISPRPGRWLQEGIVGLRRRGIEVVHLSPLDSASQREPV